MTLTGSFINSQKVTFLYKLVTGTCGESYGLNVAKMANVPQQIIDHAKEIANEFSTTHSYNSSTNEVKLSELQAFCDLLNPKLADSVKMRALESL